MKRVGGSWSAVRRCPGLYRLPSGRLYMRFRVHGEEVSQSVPEHLSIRQATDLVRHRRQEVAEGQLGFRHDEHELARLVQAYFSYKARRLKPVTVAGYRACAARFVSWLGGHGYLRVSQLDVDVVEDYAILRGREVSNVTVNREIDALRRMLTWGVRRWKRLRTNPLADWERLPEGGQRRRAFTVEEYERLLDHEHPVNAAFGGRRQPCRSADIWLVFGETGLRPGELGALRWEDVDWARGTISVPRGKTPASERRVWLSERALVCLVRRAWRGGLRGKRARGLVFTTRGGGTVVRGLWGRLRRCLMATGIETAGLVCHSFRHFYASRLLSAGVDPKAVQALLGHASSRMTMDVYGHEVAGGRERAAAALDEGAAAWRTRGCQQAINAAGFERG